MIGRAGFLAEAVTFLKGARKGNFKCVSVQGLGGVGKSTFSKTLLSELDEATFSAVIDEHVEGVEDGRAFLSEICRQLNYSGLDFEEFRKSVTNIEAALERIRTHGDNKIDTDGIVGDAANVAAGVATGIPTGKLASQALKPLVEKASTGWYRVRTAHRVHGSKAERELLDDPYIHMTKAFIRDINSYCRDRDKIFVLCADTFEYLSKKIEYFLLDYLIPIALSEGVSFGLILSGRFPLTKYDVRWVDYYGSQIFPVSLEAFEKTEVEEYINVKIKPHFSHSLPSTDDIFTATGGFPFLLERWRLNGAKAEDFDKLGGDTFDRITYWLTDEQRKWLRNLSLFDSFDRKIIDAVWPNDGEKIFGFLKNDPSICNCVSDGAYSVNEPLRVSAKKERSTFTPDGDLDGAYKYIVTHLNSLVSCYFDGRSLDFNEIIRYFTLYIDLWDQRRVGSAKDDEFELICALSIICSDHLGTANGLESVLYERKKSSLSFVLTAAYAASSSVPGPSLRYLFDLYSDTKVAVNLQLIAAMAYRRAGEFSVALRHSTIAKSVKPYSRVLLERGIILMMMGRFSAAEKDLRLAVKSNPSDVQAWAALGEVQRQSDKFTEACFSFQMATLSGDVPDFVMAEYAAALAADGKLDEAIIWAEKACSLAPDQEWNFSIAGQIEAMRGHEESSEALFQKAFSLCGDNYSRACVHALKGERNEALELLELALAQGIREKSWARYDPDWASLRTDSRFTKLVGVN